MKAGLVLFADHVGFFFLSLINETWLSCVFLCKLLTHLVSFFVRVPDVCKI